MSTVVFTICTVTAALAFIWFVILPPRGKHVHEEEDDPFSASVPCTICRL